MSQTKNYSVTNADRQRHRSQQVKQENTGSESYNGCNPWSANYTQQHHTEMMCSQQCQIQDLPNRGSEAEAYNGALGNGAPTGSRGRAGPTEAESFLSILTKEG